MGKRLTKANTIAVIGDIHGCYYTLKKLYEKVSRLKIPVYSVGDLIDRGSHSKQVLSFCEKHNIRAVMGNHEYWLLKLLNNEKTNVEFRDWLEFGGDSTVNSYIKINPDTTINKFFEKFRASNHHNILSKMPYKIEVGNIIITHAGIPTNGDETSMIFNSEMPENIEGKFQIFGHTPFKEVLNLRDYYSIIDTGCVFGHKLSAVIADTQKAKIIDILDMELDEEDAG